ncbi:MAG: hypothetical protein RMJ15_05580 [Nitrososphaerota archaeon]|nr:hypothetical protein [Candidatus Bathyarchaeota archaeon]MDW8023186.1 hypothetical protein [Nitrososphaerota archaeon]
MKHHLLRISRDEWMRQVFKVKKYYSGMRSVKGWQTGSVVIFLKKVGKADSIIGYGIVEGVESLEDMDEHEKAMCQKHGWKSAVRFSELKRFESPKLVKETVIGEWNVKGRFLHGRALSSEEVRLILEEELESVGKHSMSSEKTHRVS